MSDEQWDEAKWWRESCEWWSERSIRQSWNELFLSVIILFLYLSGLTRRQEIFVISAAALYWLKIATKRLITSLKDPHSYVRRLCHTISQFFHF